MIDSVRTFVTRLSSNAIVRLFSEAELAMPNLEALGTRKRTQRVVEAILEASDAKRGRLEGIAGHVLALSKLEEHAERALRAVCRNQKTLFERLDDNCSLEERILNIWFSDPKILDRARNLAMSYVWRDGRTHCGFMVGNPQHIHGDLSQAVEAIRRTVQKFQGGRKVHSEFFEYIDEDERDAPADQPTMSIHHIALYLETPASYVMEFPEGEDVAIPVLHRGAREVAIDYNPRTGRLDIAGKGIGGAKKFADIGQEFRLHALAGAELTAIRREEWPLQMFLSEAPPVLTPAEGFSKVHVTELALRSERQASGKATFHTTADQTAYQRMQELGIAVSQLPFEKVQTVTLTLEAFPECPDERGREVRVTLGWPNVRSFVGASLRDRRLIDAWLKQRPFNSK
jgi:hypothetical protein